MKTREAGSRNRKCAALSVAMLLFQSACDSIETQPLSDPSLANRETLPISVPDPSEDLGSLPPPEEPNPALCTNVAAMPAAQGSPLSNGIDEVLKGEIYVVYSAMDQDTNTLPLRMDATSSIFVIRGNPVAGTQLRDVVVFGAGYGDPNGATKANGLSILNKNYEVVKDALYDATNVDYVIRNCFGMSPARTRLQFYSPHGHQDHVNQEFFDGLAAKSYSLASLQIYVGAPDELATINQYQTATTPFWRADMQAKVVPLGGSSIGCGQVIHSFSVASGQMQVIGAPGHTDGSIHLLNTTLDYLFSGADVGDCSFPGHAQYLSAHKRLYKGGAAPVTQGSARGAIAASSALSADHEHEASDGCF